MNYLRVTLAALLMYVAPAAAQQPLVNDNTPVPSRSWALPNVPIPGCATYAESDRSLHARSCYEAKRVANTSVLLRAIATSGFAEWWGNPRSYSPGENKLQDHLQYFYTRRSANALGEWLGGTIGHEPLQPAGSGKNGFWNRSGAALASVVATHDGDQWRPALAPLGGSLASGFVTMACCSAHNTLDHAMGRVSLSYAGYFASAVFREFKPDLKAYAYRKFRRFN